MSYMFDFDKQLSPSAIEKKQLLFQLSRHSLIARLNQEVSSIIHIHVLLNPVWKIPEKLLQRNHTVYIQQFSFDSISFAFTLLQRTRLSLSDWLSIFSASSSQACRLATVLLYFSQLQITSSSMLRTLRTSTDRFFHCAVASLRNLFTPSTSSTEDKLHYEYESCTLKTNEFHNLIFELHKTHKSIPRVRKVLTVVN